MGLWDFSLGFYRDAAVQAACLTAQDAHGADVNLLLYLLWRARDGQSYDDAGVAAIDAAVAPWRETAVVPLRRIRRALKVAPLLPDAAAQEALRARLKALELEAERREQELLQRLTIAPASLGRPVPEAAAASLAAYGRLLGAPFPETLVSPFLERLAG